MTEKSWSGRLTLGTVLDTAGVRIDGILAIRHTYTPDGLTGTADLAPEKVLAYTRRQTHRNKVPVTAPTLWFAFMADGKRRSRFLTAYENHGPVLSEQTVKHRFFDLRPSDLLSSLRERLVVEWSGDTINWAKKGEPAARSSVVEIADPAAVPFPGFDRVIIPFTDEVTGKHYVGKADGGERLLGR